MFFTLLSGAWARLTRRLLSAGTVDQNIHKKSFLVTWDSYKMITKF